MISIQATDFRQSFFGLLAQTIKYNEPINITSKHGNAVLMSEEDYSGLMETLYLSANPEIKKSITEGLKTPWEQCVAEKEVEW